MCVPDVVDADPTATQDPYHESVDHLSKVSAADLATVICFVLLIT